jgi:dTDP-6-deoxy-L-talose 4-dehydrogenase (NAD+)
MERQVCGAHSRNQNILIHKSNDMKVLVTGATGFLGSYVVPEMLKHGYAVVATSRSDAKARLCEWFSQVKYISWDLNDAREDYFSFFGKPEMLIHLAWEGLPNYTDLSHFERNLFSNYIFLKNMLEHGLRNVIVAGTCFEYGMRNGALHEDMETDPQNPYGLAKDTLRKVLEQLQKKIDFDFKWIRLFYMYGTGQNPTSVISQLDSALERGETIFNMSRGEQLRDYLPVEKAAEYIARIAVQSRIKGVINCCSGAPVSIRKLMEDYLTKLQKNIHLNLGYYSYPDHEPMAFWGDRAKLNNVLNS